MKLAANSMLDALCGEYLLGTLRGAARRRFERASREEPLVGQRLQYWQGLVSPRYMKVIEVEPPSRVWARLERELNLSRYRTPWYRRAAFWRGWAIGATLALLAVIALEIPEPASVDGREIAQLAAKDGHARLTAVLHGDGRTLELRGSRPVLAGPEQSYELWLLPREGGNPVSLAVVGSLDARFRVPADKAERLRAGGKLAVSVEPAGGSPTGAPTGPVILAGEITI